MSPFSNFFDFAGLVEDAPPDPLKAPRFRGNDVLASCLTGHVLSATSGDPPEAVAPIQQALVSLGLSCPVDGVFGSDTATALTAYKTNQGISPADPTVEAQTMAALDADFEYELFDLKAKDLASTRFALGERKGARVESTEGFATCEYESGTCIELAQIVVFAIPASVYSAWQEAGGPHGDFGLPTGDPIDLDGTRAAQEFANQVRIFGGGSDFDISRPIWEASLMGQGMIGGPSGEAEAIGTDGSTFAPHDTGVVLAVAESLPQALPQPVFDLWQTQNTGGSPLGAPTAFAFPSAAGTVHPFATADITLDAGGSATVTAPNPSNLDRYFQPPDPVQHLLSPVNGVNADYVVGAPDVLKAMAKDIASVSTSSTAGTTDFIYMANWHCESEMPLVPGDASTTISSLLQKAVAAGVQVRALFWFGPIPADIDFLEKTTIPQRFLYDVISPRYVEKSANFKTATLLNSLAGDCKAVLDSRHLPIGSHHQKILVVGTNGNLIAWVGGVEPNTDRLPPPTSKGSPLFDISVRLQGAAAVLAMLTFVGRWNAHPDAPAAPLLRSLSFSNSAPAPGPLKIQVTHTFGAGFPYVPAVHSAAAALSNALRNARKFFYIEDQYCIGSPLMMDAITDGLARNRSAVGIIVIANETCVVGDLPDLPYRRRAFLSQIAAVYPTRFFVFERFGLDGTDTGPYAYVHSKIMIVDDEAAFIGSVNSSRRSWFHDSEVGATVVDTNGPGGTAAGSGRGWVRNFRCTVWSNHLPAAAVGSLGDPDVDIAVWKAIHDKTQTSPTVQPYDIFPGFVQRYMPRGIPFVNIPGLLDSAWDGLEDPPAWTGVLLPRKP